MKRKLTKIELRFIAKMREKRKARGMSQATLAKILRVLRTTIVNLEVGNSGVTLTKAVEIADILDISLDELI